MSQDVANKDTSARVRENLDKERSTGYREIAKGQLKR